MAFYLIGLDLGGSKLSAGLTDTDCRLISQERESVTAPWEVNRTLDAMADIAQRVARHVGTGAVLGMGVAVAGFVDRAAGVVVASPNLGWQQVPLRDELEARLPWKVFVGNDVNLATLGEWQQGAGKGSESMMGVFVGTGLGAGLVLDGALYEGRHGSAGQMGRVLLPAVGTERGTRRARLEEIASGPALCHRVRRALLAGQSSEIRLQDGQVSPEEIGRAEAEGDGLALATIADAAEALGVVIANAVTLVDPERVVLGGGVVRAIPSLVGRVQAIVRQHVGFMGVPCPHEVSEAALGRDAPVIGATALARMAGRLVASR